MTALSQTPPSHLSRSDVRFQEVGGKTCKSGIRRILLKNSACGGVKLLIQ